MRSTKPHSSTNFSEWGCKCRRSTKGRYLVVNFDVESIAFLNFWNGRILWGINTAEYLTAFELDTVAYKSMCVQFLLCCGLSRVVIMTFRIQLPLVISTDDLQIVTLWNNVLHHYNLSLSVSALSDANAGYDTLVTMIHCHTADRGIYFRLFSLCIRTS